MSRKIFAGCPIQTLVLTAIGFKEIFALWFYWTSFAHRIVTKDKLTKDKEVERKMTMNDILKYDEAAEGLSDRLKHKLKGIPGEMKRQIREIHVRLGRPLTVNTGREELFVTDSGDLCRRYTPHAYRANQSDLNESFKVLCGYSVHSCQNEIRSGFLTIRGGHRAGICGTAVTERGKLSGVRDISSISLRVARQVIGAADELIRAAYPTGTEGFPTICGTLIVGIPASGKTTLLRDLIRQMASGNLGRIYKVAVVDERGELGASFRGEPQNDLGYCCDLLDGYPKGEGMNLALRTLSPHVIVCDEIGAQEDADAVLDSLNAGVSVIATAHASNLEELLRRRQIARLLTEGAFQKIVFLKGANQPAKVARVFDWEEIHAEINRDRTDDCGDDDGWIKHVGQFVQAGV